MRLKILMYVFKWAFKGWIFDIDVEAEEETENVKSVTLKATFPDKQS